MSLLANQQVAALNRANPPWTQTASHPTQENHRAAAVAAAWADTGDTKAGTAGPEVKAAERQRNLAQRNVNHNDR